MTPTLSFVLNFVISYIHLLSTNMLSSILESWYWDIADKKTDQFLALIQQDRKLNTHVGH